MLLLWLAIGLGTWLRISPALGSGFPINDGGLFASVIDQLVQNGMRPPEWVLYNGTEIPFAYPPMAFYLAGALSAAGLDTFLILRLVPALLASLTIAAWYFLARALFSPTVAGVAALMYALTPVSYEWLVAGGGITRALGMLLTLVALRAVIIGYRSASPVHVIAGGAATGLAVLAHPEAGLFCAASVVYFAWVERAGLRLAISVVAVAAATAAPWFLFVIARYGTSPLTSVGGSRVESYIPALIDIAGMTFTHAVIMPLIAVLGAVGLFAAATSGRIWLAGWVGVAILSAPSMSPAVVAIMWSAAAAITIVEEIRPRLSSRAAPALLAAGSVLVLLGAVWAPLAPGSAIVHLPEDVREAISWVDENIPPSSEVAVVTGVFWARDATAEWFPHLTAAVSVGTVQGQEFTGRWSAAVEGQRALIRCSHQTVDCLDKARNDHFPNLEYAFLPKGQVPGNSAPDCCLALRESLRDTAQVIYDGVGATVYRLQPSPGQ